jgi:hypothetical protein
VILALAASAGLVAEWASRAPGGTRATATRSAPADIDTFLAPYRVDRSKTGWDGRLSADPLAARRPSVGGEAVARPSGVPTVSSGNRGRRLTAILIISDDRSVAVIDDAVVGVGDKLADGSRVDAIQSDRVSVVERNGQKRVLTLTAGRQ